MRFCPISMSALRQRPRSFLALAFDVVSYFVIKRLGLEGAKQICRFQHSMIGFIG
jgi:hypothetical protein